MSPQHPDTPKWYAIYTRPRAEKLVYSRLREKGIECFLPLQKTIRQWSDRKKVVEKPLLSSYVFVQVNKKEAPQVFRINGVVKFISFEGKPVPIPQEQIDYLKLLVNSDAKLDVTSEKFVQGDKVEVIGGALNGLKGELMSTRGRKRVIVRIDSLEKNIIVTIPAAFLRKV